jgi:hypothetical protein
MQGLVSDNCSHFRQVAMLQSSYRIGIGIELKATASHAWLGSRQGCLKAIHCDVL